MSAYHIAKRIANLKQHDDIETFGPLIIDAFRGESATDFFAIDNAPGRFNYLDDRFYMVRCVRNHPKWGKALRKVLKY